MFADDTAAFAVDRYADFAAVRLQRQLDAYVAWVDTWKMSVNAAKSTVVYFSKRRKRPRDLTIGRTRLALADTVKYLGLHLDRRLTWRVHSRHVATKRQSRLTSLAPLLRSASMTRPLGKRLVSTYVLPVATYAIPVWGYLAASHKRRL